MRDRNVQRRHKQPMSGSIRSHGGLGSQENIPALYHMVQRGHLDVPVIGVARAGRTNEHLKERVRDSIQQQGSEIDQEALPSC